MNTSIWTDIFKYKKHINIIEILRDIPVFEGLSKLDLLKISKLLHLRQYKKDEFIFREKEPGESMYIIKSGSIEITKCIKKETVTLSSLEKGSFFGEISLVDSDSRSATAKAKEDTQLLGFFRADLMHLIDRNPRLASFILYQLSRVLGKRLRVLDASISNHHVPTHQ
ncbi:hypothetical protein DID78_00205 [Candidatus Marinamargulisbacteria bacterium SCGC AG-343-D04]|nr:hypothetical protein DID78_00205 [Candidatus Marinamargulisbacteria bacterium SCGC AG-343-D04]